MPGAELFDLVCGLLHLVAEFLFHPPAGREGEAARGCIDFRIVLSQFGEAGASVAKLLLDGFAGRIGHGTIRIIGFHFIINQRIDRVLFP